MLNNCAIACSVCHVKDIPSLILETMGEKEANVEESELGVIQEVTGDRNEEVLKRIDNITNYFETIVKIDPKFDKVRKECKNRHNNCAFWAVLGEVSS